MGDDKPWPEVPVGNADHTEAAVVIIGAGITGTCVAIDLLPKNNCKNIIILEKSNGLGGIWRDEKYPGCCCDVLSYLYSYPFAADHDWTREHSGNISMRWPKDRGLQVHTIQFRCGKSKMGCHFPKLAYTCRGAERKIPEVGQSHATKSDYLVSAVGQLNVPQLPDIEGLAKFRGKIMHRAKWDWSYALTKQRIAIFGNGATAAPIIPEVALAAERFTFYQRTPNWVVPRLGARFPIWRRVMYRTMPYIGQRKRADIVDFRESFDAAVYSNKTPESQ